MNLTDTIIGIIVVGIIATYFYFIPTTTMKNMNDSNKIINYTNVLDEVAFKIEKENWNNYATDEEKRTRATELINLTKEENKNKYGEDFELKGEVININGEKFIKVWIQDEKIYQEYFFDI